MINMKQIPFLFKIFFITFLLNFLLLNHAYSQDIKDENDFTNAENAEEKRIKWGT